MSNMNIVPFSASAQLPAYLSDAFTMFADINKDIVRAPSFPSISIKGKVFTINKDGLKTIVQRPNTDGEMEAAQSIGVTILRANMNAKTFYMAKFKDGDSDGKQPDCYSFDGVSPSANAPKPQCSKCAICPHNQWGSRQGDGDKEEAKGKACADNARLAVATPDKLNEPMLIRVPPASLKPLREMTKELNARKVPYNVLVTRIGFDPAAPSPKLTFKPAGFMPQDTLATLKEMYDSEDVRAICGIDDIGVEHVVPAGEAEPDVTTKVIEKAKAESRKPVAPAPAVAAIDEAFDEPAPAPAPVKAKAAKPAEPKPAPAAKPAESGVSALLGDMDALLSNFDD